MVYIIKSKFSHFLLNMIIVQLSDIHVGSQFQEDVFDKVLQEVNEIKPDCILITGDLTNEGLKSEYEKCKKLL